MRKSRFSEQQIATALRQVESGAPVVQVSRRLGISEATFYLWKKQYAHLSASELREVRQLREENAKLKRLPISLDKVMLQDVLGKKTDGRLEARMGADSGCPVSANAAPCMPAVGVVSVYVPLRAEAAGRSAAASEDS